MSRLKLAEGMVIGASAVYLLDPDKGRERRGLLAARLGEMARTGYRRLADRRERRKARPGPRRLVAVLRPATAWRFLHRRPMVDAGWESPMATVDIDIDQGVVTLSGLFPAQEEAASEPRARKRGPQMTLIETKETTLSV